MDKEAGWEGREKMRRVRRRGLERGEGRLEAIVRCGVAKDMRGSRSDTDDS